MAYEYEERNRGVILAGTLFDDGDIEKQLAFEELKEVYSKAKAWEKLKDVIKDDYCDLSEEYNIEKLFHCKAIGKTMDLLEGSTDFNDFIKGE